MANTTKRPKTKSTTRKRAKRPTLGWREYVGLPDLGIDRVKAKIDTGARSSALHATDLDYFTHDDEEWVRFIVRPAQRSAKGRKTVEAPLVDRRPVVSSSGTSELRPFVETTIVVGGHAFTIEVNLTDRRDMGFRMLLGRAAVRRRFLVDPGRSYLSPRPPKSQGAA